MQIFTALPVIKKTLYAGYVLTYVLLSMYLPGGPFMYFHMVSQVPLHAAAAAAVRLAHTSAPQRKSAFKARKEASKPADKPNGLLFPMTNKETGERSTTEIGRTIFEAATAAVDPDTAKAIGAEKNWSELREREGASLSLPYRLAVQALPLQQARGRPRYRWVRLASARCAATRSLPMARGAVSRARRPR
jgi:hypothetical protein